MNMKYAMRSEDTEQINVVSWANWNVNRYPELRWLFHVPNGGSRNKQEAVKFKQMGVKAGVGGTYKTGDLIRPTEYSHVDIIPANGYLMKTDMNLLLKSEDNQVTRLREALEEVSDAYDYCVCDCGRLLDMVVINILIAAELIIAPVKVGGYEIEALQNLEEQIEDLRDINPDLRIKALMTMRQKNKTSLEVEEWLKAESGFDMFVTPIRRSIIAEKSTTAMIPLPKFSKRGIVSQDYRCVVHELLTEMEGETWQE